MYYQKYEEDREYLQEISRLENFYPEVYRKINSIIKNSCQRCTKSLEKEDLETMVDEIYNKLESNNELVANIGINQNRDIRQRRPENSLLRDLIKILVLNNLIGNRPKPPYPNGPRPPMPPPPPRPGPMNNYLRF